MKIEKIYSLSPMQEGMLFHALMDKDTSMYFEQTSLSIEGIVDIEVLEKSFSMVVNRHGILRSIFIHNKFKLPQQVVLKERQASILYKDFSDINGEENRKIKVQKYLEEDRKRGFDLSRDMLIRISVLKLDEKLYKMVLSFHHIILDGWSLGIVMNELLEIYGSFINKVEPKLMKTREYSDFINWLEAKDKEVSKEFWKSYLKDYEGKTLIPKYRTNKLNKVILKEFKFFIEEDLVLGLQKIGRENSITLNIIMQTIWGILLQKYSNTNDVVFGFVTSGRNASIKDVEKIIGMLINTVHVRINSNNCKNFVDLLNKVQNEILKLSDHEHSSLAEVKSILKIKENLIDNLFVFENYYVDDKLKKFNNEEIGFNINGFEAFEQTNYDFTMIVSGEKEITIKFQYNGAIYDDITIENISKHLKNIIKQIVANPKTSISEISLIDESEKEKILWDFNNTKVNYEKDKTIQELFEEQVEKTPRNIAVEFGDEKVTYKELNEKANSLSRTLREKGVSSESIVGIMVERSIDMIVGMLGILKAGAAYLPIDFEQPDDRIKYILKNCEVACILTQKRFIDSLDYGLEIIDLKDNEIYEKANTNIKNINNGENLAYVIYTSGSTGLPKGVLIEHRSVVRLVKNTNYININDDDVILQLSNYAFDGSIFDIYGALLNGAKLVLIAKNDLLQINKLGHVIVNRKVSILFVTTALFNTIVDTNIEYLKNTRKILFGGERISVKHAEKALGYLGNGHLIHVYGPTEGTVYTTYFCIDKIERDAENIPIGKSLSNSTAYIVGNNNELLPVGIPGELCISGDGLARGYLKSSELTAEKFIDNPFERDKKMYKTGDLTRWLPDGNIEFLGRIDNQVKIRGFRIELGEIESRLLENKWVKETRVVVKESKDKEKYICAYVISEKSLEELNLKNYLKELLPEYMIPNYFISLDKVPLTSNGKLNMSELPEPIFGADINKYEGPRNEIEEALCKIWSEVLGNERVGINDNFFDLGGHSLKATVLMSQIHKELNKEIPLKELFKYPTIKELIKSVESAEENPYSKIERIELREFYETSSAQKRMYMLKQFDKDNVVYNIPVVFELEGLIKKEKIEETFKQLIIRHEALRTSFETIDGEIVQKLQENYNFKLINKKENRSIENVINDFIIPFNLEKAPLFRVELVESQGKTYLLIDMHHIISDGVSMGILMKEFKDIYNGVKLETLKLQYKDFAVWQNKFLKSEEMKNQEEYWIKRFSDEIPVLNLPYDFERPSIQSFDGDSVGFELSKTVTDKLRKISSKTGTTMQMILLSAFNILLSKYSGQDDIVVGIPIAGRPHSDLQNIMGMFVNTLALRNNPEGHKSYLDFLREVKENSLKAYENQGYQLETLVEKLDIRRDTGRNPLFDVTFNMLDMVLDSHLQLEDLSLKQYINENKISKFDMALNAMDSKEELKFSIDYCTKLFNKETIKRLSRYFIKILDVITNDIEIKICDIELLTEEEKTQILYKLNETKADYPKGKTIQELFESQVEKTPDNIAVAFREEKITYRELNEKSNSLAKTLRNKGIKADSIVGIMVGRSPEMIIGILAILKAGGAYLPMDPKLPRDRIEYMIEDSGINVLLTSKELINKVEFDGCLLDITDKEIYKEESYNLEVINECNNLAYIIYTSGTTGKPKGVMVEHNNVVRLMFNDKIQFDFNHRDVWTMFHSYCFDFSVWEMYGALLYGGKLVIVPETITKDFEEYLELLRREKVTILNQTPTAFYNLMNLDMIRSGDKLNLRYIIFGGEALNPNMLDGWKKKYNKTKIINMYGITETTVHVTYKEIGEEEIRKGISNIGTAIPTLTTYVMDKNLKIQPIGVPGELCVGGDGVARGYLNRPELTSKKFVMNPYIKNERIYKSGDLVKLLENGELEYLGRIDNQVKIRGFRIELGEIENRLLKHEDVKEANVIVIEDEEKEKYICAYLVSRKEVNELHLRDYLKESLPEYMVPAYFMQLERMPLTVNGKLDRRALPKPEMHGKSNEYEAPTNEIEEKLSKIWSEVLKIDKVGINDNFFELGGHSLKATMLTSKIHKELSKEVSLKELFKYPTIKELSKSIDNAKENIYSNIEKLEEREFYESASVQKRMYMLYEFDKDNMAYNMPMAFEIKGDFHAFKIDKIFKKLIERHEALRTYFKMIDGEIVQKINNCYEFKLVCNKTNDSINEVMHKFIKPFDLQKAPLFRIEIAESNEKSYLLVDMHHIIMDGVSLNILIKEFVVLYNGGEVEPLKLQYKDFATWQNNFLKSEEMKKQEEYWVNCFSGEIPIINLPYDYERPPVKSFQGDTINFEFDEITTRKIRSLAKETGTTMYMVLLSVFNILLAKYSGQEDIIVGTPVAGRPHAELQDIVGMFVNTLVLRNKPEGNKKYSEFLEEVRDNSLKAYEYQSYQLDSLVEKINVRRDKSRNSLFDVMFNMIDGVSEDVMDIGDFSLASLEVENKISKFDLALNVLEEDKTVKLNIEYCVKLFKKETIEKLSMHYVKILDTIINNTEIELCEIDLLSEQEKNQILYEFNDMKVDYPKDKTIQELFEQQVLKTPNNIAVVYEDRKLTYKELNEKSNQLARVLKTKGVTKDSIITIMVERSLEMVIGIMGILKSGGAYLPIDSNLPKERIEYIMKNSRSKILVSKQSLIDKLKIKGEFIDLYNNSLFNGENGNLEKINNESSLAYVIYTSGTTGNPKGVMIEHRNLNNLVLGLNKNIYGKYNEYLNVCLVAPYYFDASVKQIFGALLNGHSLYITDDYTRRDGEKLLNYYEKYHIDVSDGTPMHMSMMVNSDLLQKSSLKIKEYIIGGEELNLGVIKEYYENCRAEEKPYVNNVYGPTECCVDSSIYTVDSNDIEGMKILPIGKPMINYKIYIVDKYKKLLPIGVPGELCIAGDGVGRGYLYNPELTSEKFVDNSFDLGTKMYMTGDLAKWLPDGNIEFLGRIDNQVKIRGFRIELGEIENKLLHNEDIKEVAVVVNENNEKEKYICAYIVSQKEINQLNLRSYLKENLPEYMIPNYFIKIEKMPVTSNGKVDRKLLPKPRLDDIISKYEAPRNEVEEKITQIWCSVLELDRIGINDNFFELGGNSIKMIKLINKLNLEFNRNIDFSELYNMQSIKEMARPMIEDYILSEEDTKDQVLLLNKKREKNIFAFPPISGYGIVYKGLANSLRTHSLYAFDFIESNDRLEKYVNSIIKIQSQGPYVLAGYSAGGNLAFEVAKMLIEKGHKVSNIIMIDSFKKDLEIKTPEEIENQVRYLIDGIKNDEIYGEYITEDLIEKNVRYKILTYSNYINRLINDGQLPINIKLLLSLENKKRLEMARKWNVNIDGEFKVYEGVGSHNEVLNLKENIDKLKQIIESLS